MVWPFQFDEIPVARTGKTRETRVKIMTFARYLCLFKIPFTDYKPCISLLNDNLDEIGVLSGVNLIIITFFQFFLNRHESCSKCANECPLRVRPSLRELEKWRPSLSGVEQQP